MHSTAPIALITGAAKRLGREVALHLARNGYDIAVHYATSHTEAEATCADIRALGRRAVAVKGDLREPAQTSEIYDAAMQALGPPSVLIHNASYFTKDELATLEPAAWEAHMRIHAESPLYLTQNFVDGLPEDTQGNVLCFLDGMTGWSLSPYFLSYSLSKLTFANAIPLLASQFAPRLRINGIALGATLPGHMDTPSTFDTIRAVAPLGITSSPEELCRTVSFLLESPCITGQIIQLNSGMHLPPIYAKATEFSAHPPFSDKDC